MSSKTVQISSPSQFNSLISSSTIVVADFYADWCGPCKAIAPLYEQLSTQLSRPNRITFTKINTDQQQDIARSYNVNAMPTFLVFKNAREVTRIRGADAAKLSEAVKKLAAEANSSTSSTTGFGEGSSAAASGDIPASWITTALPRGYTDITSQVDVRGLDLLNGDSEFGAARVLFDDSAPSALKSAGGGGAKKPTTTGDGAEGSEAKKDWVESDTDEQLMLYMPFQSTLKIHTLYLTSLPPSDGEGEISRPKTVKLYTNRAHVLGFEEAEDIPPTQTITLAPADWDAASGSAKVELRFVKFQNVSSLVLFVVDGEAEGGERTRVDRVRLVGDAGEKRAMGKLEKVGDEQGE